MKITVTLSLANTNRIGNNVHSLFKAGRRETLTAYDHDRIMEAAWIMNHLAAELKKQGK